MKEELIKQGKIKRDKKKSVIFRGEDNSCITFPAELQSNHPERRNASRLEPVKDCRPQAGSVFDHIDYHSWVGTLRNSGFKSVKEKVKLSED